MHFRVKAAVGSVIPRWLYFTFQVHQNFHFLLHIFLSDFPNVPVIYHCEIRFQLTTELAVALKISLALLERGLVYRRRHNLSLCHPNFVVVLLLWILSPSGLPLLAWWRYQMETFSTLLALCEGNPPVTVGFPSQRPVTRNFYISLICAGTNSWANNRDAGDLRRYRAHYDVTVMVLS